MKLEIWSDVMCPFCYIGKRRLEKAIAALKLEDIEIEYKSFLLNADLKTDPSLNAQQHLADSKGMSLEQVNQMFGQVTAMAKGEGLNFDFDKSIVANSINAHRILHLAKKEGKQAEVKELLLKAHFEEGKNIDDAPTLQELAEKVGISKDKCMDVLQSDAFSDDLRADIQKARSIGVQGVPFFVKDGKYAISGAQSVEVFMEFLEKAGME
ncbi:DsbA family oxidoreductase [Brumimicrobium oceani]|uniref:Disulfide bond formation protein DsbA n=1 Tax=Brumimicrobium oceani TaxID=2100725 RepID=A0A2U2XC40_9FLAO|nr:DsbA family oxidoreductase [Brumimicrobium oceani]PWH85271.1 disulfide bond formation protein DsbA [Brumimicrobium oceani]